MLTGLRLGDPIGLAIRIAAGLDGVRRNARKDDHEHQEPKEAGEGRQQQSSGGISKQESCYNA